MDWLARTFGGNARGIRNADSAFRSAFLAILDRDFDVAEEELTKAVRAGADGVDSHLALAGLCRLRGEIGRALRGLIPLPSSANQHPRAIDTPERCGWLDAREITE